MNLFYECKVENDFQIRSIIYLFTSQFQPSSFNTRTAIFFKNFMKVAKF